MEFHLTGFLFLHEKQNTVKMSRYLLLMRENM